MSKPQDLIRCLAICRPDTNPVTPGKPKHEILGFLPSSKGDPLISTYEDHMIKIMGKTHKLTSGKRIRLTAEEFEVHVQCEMDGATTLLFIAVSDPEFGVHHMIPSFFDDWKTSFTRSVPRSEWGASKNALNTRVKSCIQTIHSKYNTSSIRKVNAQVQDVKGVMQDSVDLALANVERLDDLDAKSADIEASSRQFHHNAKKVRCAMCVEYWKMIVIIIIIAVVIAIILAVVLSQLLESKNTK